LAKKALEFGEKCKIRDITPWSLKVIEVDINRKPECDFLLVISTNWHPISYHFGVIAAYGSTTGSGSIMFPVVRPVVRQSRPLSVISR